MKVASILVAGTVLLVGGAGYAKTTHGKKKTVASVSAPDIPSEDADASKPFDRRPDWLKGRQDGAVRDASYTWNVWATDQTQERSQIPLPSLDEEKGTKGGAAKGPSLPLPAEVFGGLIKRLGGGDSPANPQAASKPQEMTPERAVQNLSPISANLPIDPQNKILTDAEISFACNVALGLPFPIRTGKISEFPRDGLVLFNPQMYRADLENTEWKDRIVTYRVLKGSDVLAQGEARVRDYVVMKNPGEANSMEITCDQDVVAYGLKGLPAPTNQKECRDQIVANVADIGSTLRLPAKILGLRYELLPVARDIGQHPQCAARLRSMLKEMGLDEAAKMPKPGQAN